MWGLWAHGLVTENSGKNATMPFGDKNSKIF